MRKINYPNVVAEFKDDVENLKKYLCECKLNGTEPFVSNCYEYGIIKLYKSFEVFLYKTIITCINHDSSKVCAHYKVQFGKHISDSMCNFILTKGGYFDFKGWSKLIEICTQHIGDTYGVVDILKKGKNGQYKKAIEELIAFRNYAAHSSEQSKESVKRVLGRKRIPQMGNYLKEGNRLENIADILCSLADELNVAIN